VAKAGGGARARLDVVLVERGLFESRSRAAAAVLAGDVRLGPSGERATKPGQLVRADAPLSLAEKPAYVARSGLKLANALDAFDLDPTGRRALDVGASTGGFTDCLLQRGAERVVCVDVAYGMLHWSLRNDPRVTVLERTNARALAPALLPYLPDLTVADLSFISLAKALPAALACAAPSFDCLALVKPQFEVGREKVGRGGVVRSADERRSALVAVGAAFAALGFAVLGFASSGLPGPAGNRESFMRLAEPGRPAPAGSLEELAGEAEP